MIPNSLEALLAEDIENLVATGAEEGVSLDFKRDLPGRDRDATKEFIADVCALANTKGGDLVFGIEEGAEGQAERVVPFSLNADEEITRLTNVLTDGLEPRLHGVRMQAVAMTGGSILIIRVPRSFSGIHRSRRDGHFWVRESRSKRQLDVPGITSRIGELLGREDRVADFFARRYAAIAGGSYPLNLQYGPKLVIHVLPTRDILSGEEVDLSPLSEAGTFFTDAGSRSSSASNTFEGILHHTPVQEGSVRAGTLLFRSGVVESVSGINYGTSAEGVNTLYFESVERSSVGFLKHALKTIAEKLAGGWPLTVRIALVGAHEYVGNTSNQEHHWNYDLGYIAPVRVQAPVLSLPDILVERIPASVPLLLQPAFDRLWQSWGYSKSLSYKKSREGSLFWLDDRTPITID